jgi:8-hydroxy-5-deazaflavin:NADPH oxidoreductase
VVHAAGAVAGHPLDIFTAGHDERARGLVARLVSDGGMRPIEAGSLARAPHGSHFASAVNVLS